MAFLALVSVGCSDPVGPTVGDGGTNGCPGADAGPTPDAGQPDAGQPDAGLPDAGAPDAGPDAGPGDGGLQDAGWSGTWELFGPPLGHEAQVYPAMALDGSGTPLVAYAALVESTGAVATELHVVRWSGTAWVPLGGTVASSADRFPYSAPLFVRLATDGAGRPVIAFGDSGPGATTGAFPLQTAVFDGTSWKTVAMPFAAPQLSGIALGVGTDGLVRLAIATGQALRFLVLGVSGWSELLPPLLDDAGVSEPDLALAGDGSPLVAFSEAAAPGSFGSLHAVRWNGAGWSDLGLPSPAAPDVLFHTPRIRERTDGGVVVAASEWQFDPLTKFQIGVASPVFALSDGEWSLLENEGAPGGSGLSEPIPGAPVDLQLSNDVPVLVSTGADGGVMLRALVTPGAPMVAPGLQGLGAGTLILLPDRTPLVGAVLPVSPQIGPEQADGGQVQILHFTGSPAP